MGTSTNWLGAMRCIEAQRLEDAVFEARKVLTRLRAEGRWPSQRRLHSAALLEAQKEIPESWPSLPCMKHPDLQGVLKMLAFDAARPDHPANWHRRAVEREQARPRVAGIYHRLRRALWTWPEFAALTAGARKILEVVIELNRDEAFPWYLPVQSEEVRRLARLSERRFIGNLRELDCLAITHPARIVKLRTARGDAHWPGRIDANEPELPQAQWVVRYRRGIPWNAKRAAWWINYDLLCETGRGWPIFLLQLRTLSKPYFARNRKMGGAIDGVKAVVGGDAEAFAELEHGWVRNGPMPRAGMRAALWEERWPETGIDDRNLRLANGCQDIEPGAVLRG